MLYIVNVKKPIKKRSHLFIGQRDENVKINLTFRGTTLFHPAGCPQMQAHHNSVTGVPVCPYFVHGSRSAVSSATILRCLAPSDISLQVEKPCVLFRFSAFNIKIKRIIPYFFSFVNRFLKIFRFCDSRYLDYFFLICPRINDVPIKIHAEHRANIRNTASVGRGPRFFEWEMSFSRR